MSDDGEALGYALLLFYYSYKKSSQSDSILLFDQPQLPFNYGLLLLGLLQPFQQPPFHALLHLGQSGFPIPITQTLMGRDVHGGRELTLILIHQIECSD